jgi:hypothetical protein
MLTDKTYQLPNRPNVDVTPELVRDILQELPQHDEGHFAVTVTTESLKRLLEHAGATVVLGYKDIKGEGPEA